MRKTDLDTPALLVDLECMESNLRKMSAFFGEHPAKLRPHFKNHRVINFALRQMEAGAIGLTCARLWQAELLVEHGINNILIANEIAGEGMVRRFAALSRVAPVIVAVDNARVVDDLARVARDEHVELNVVVDVDLGLRRCGVQPGEPVVALAKRVAARGLKLRGVMGYEGHLQPLYPGPEKEQLVTAAMQALVQSKEWIEREGFPVEIVSCGGTGDYYLSGRYPGVTENQAGSFLLMDTWYSPFAPDFQPSLTVLVTVLSKTPGERIVVDAGVKALSGERGLPLVKGTGGLFVKALHAEHAIIEITDPSVSVEVGDKLEIWVHYHDGTINLHGRMYGIRNGGVEEIFPIEHEERHD
jgi:D-serine deaminase-like pyridoxal phosphate-dependent protein